MSMKRKISDQIKAVVILTILIVITRRIEDLPWWFFVLPVLIFGVIIAFVKWNVSTFGVGFLVGFLIWLGADLYFSVFYGGIILGKIAMVLSMPKIAVIIISALIGGLVTGLALYTGARIFVYAKLNKEDEISE